MRALGLLGLTFAVMVVLVSPIRAQALPDLGVPISSPNQRAPASNDDTTPLGQSSVSVNDSSVPEDTLRLRFDAGYHIPRPTRAEYFQAKGGLPNSPGMPLPEPNINSYQEAMVYAEFAPVSFFSVFVEGGMRWLNPEVNQNIYGYGDTNFGFKLCTWNTQDLIATLQLRCYAPTAQKPGLGTNHWTIEPALLAMWRPFDNITVEGDFRYWSPMGGTDFAGDIVRYGVGVSLGQSNGGLWFKPVVELVGWTVLGGESLVVTSPESFFVQSAAGQTIVNGYFGLRLGVGNAFDCYAGYGRCFTGNTWSRDFVRVEFRLFY